MLKDYVLICCFCVLVFFVHFVVGDSGKCRFLRVAGLRSYIFVPVMPKTLHKSSRHVLVLVALKFEQETQIIA